MYQVSLKSDNGKLFKIRPSLRLHNFFSKINFDTRFKMNFVGTMDISSCMQSENPRIEGKHITKLAKNGMTIVTLIYMPWSLDLLE